MSEIRKVGILTNNYIYNSEDFMTLPSKRTYEGMILPAKTHPCVFFYPERLAM